METGIIYWVAFISLVGLFFLMYGKRSRDGLAIVTGLVLSIYPYFVGSLGWSIVTGVVICAAYLFLKFVARW